MQTPPPGSLGRLLREIRERQGLAIEDLAAASDVSVTTISTLERGITSRPHRATVRKLAGALGLSDDELASFETAGRRGRARPASKSDRNTGDVANLVVSPALGLAACGATA